MTTPPPAYPNGCLAVLLVIFAFGLINHLCNLIADARSLKRDINDFKSEWDRDHSPKVVK